MNLKEARTSLREWSADLAALKDQVDVSIDKNDPAAAHVLAAWKKAREGFTDACLNYLEAE